MHSGLHKRQFLVGRFVLFSAFMLFLMCGGMAFLTLLFARLSHIEGQPFTPPLTPLGQVAGIAVAMLIPLIGILIAGRSFVRFASPMADVMAAADAVADGDLSVQVRARGQGQMRDLARSFNHMVQELQRADQQRRNLTADVAHELRTPLQIIQGNLEGVLDGIYEPTANHIEATLDETRLLARLVEDLRTLSLAEAGQLPLNLEPLDIREFLEDVQTSFSGQAEAAGITLSIETDPGIMYVNADVGRLDQVFGNLLSNALRYTPTEGNITLKAATVDSIVRIQVQDTGAGIPPEELPYIFDRFWRGDRARTHAGGASSGLGLAIAKQLIQAHNGRISVESTVGEGTTFTIVLPQVQSTPDEPRKNIQ
mgnify:CR=1 FL=1